MANDVQTYIGIRGPQEVLERIEEALATVDIGAHSNAPTAPAFYVLGDIAECLGINRAPIDAQGWSDVA